MDKDFFKRSLESLEQEANRELKKFLPEIEEEAKKKDIIKEQEEIKRIEKEYKEAEIWLSKVFSVSKTKGFPEDPDYVSFE